MQELICRDLIYINVYYGVSKLKIEFDTPVKGEISFNGFIQLDMMFGAIDLYNDDISSIGIISTKADLLKVMEYVYEHA